MYIYVFYLYIYVCVYQINIARISRLGEQKVTLGHTVALRILNKFFISHGGSCTKCLNVRPGILSDTTRWKS